MKSAFISAIEYYLPAEVLDNAELSRLFPTWSPAQIEKKTGIRARHIAAENETSADMAVSAAEALFKKRKASAQEIDFVLLCTQSPDYFLPTSACLVQERLGIPSTAGALDFNLGCSGFVYGLSLAKGLVETGAAQCVLLLTSETYSKYLSPGDKSVRTIFGDGAAATIVRGGEAAGDRGPFIGPFVFGTDGSGGSSLIVAEGCLRNPRATMGAASGPFLHMDGPSIFSFTLRRIPPMVDELLRRGGTTRDAVDLFIFHQANSFMLETLRVQMNIAVEKFVVDLSDKGNTVSSTIPIAMADAYASGILKSGNRIVIVGFGVGLSWASALVVLPGAI